MPDLRIESHAAMQRRAMRMLEARHSHGRVPVPGLTIACAIADLLSLTEDSAQVMADAEQFARIDDAWFGA